MSYALDIPPLMTVEEFLVWDAPDDRTWQLVDGEAQALAPASSSSMQPIAVVVMAPLHKRPRTI